MKQRQKLIKTYAWVELISSKQNTVCILLLKNIFQLPL